MVHTKSGNEINEGFILSSDKGGSYLSVMPGLVAFKRRWGIGSDDLVFPVLVELLLHILWSVIVVSLFIKHKVNLDCQGDRLLYTYLIGLQIGQAIFIVLDILIIWISTRGTITQTRPRRHLPKLLYLRLILVIPELIWNILGTKWAFTYEDHLCEDAKVVLTVQVIATCGWPFIIGILVGMCLVFDPVGASHYKLGHRVGDVERGEPQSLYINLNTAEAAKAKKVWECRMKLLCCLASSDEQSKNAYSDIAKLFASYFEDVDLVPSDIAAGLILLNQKQSYESAARTSTSQHSETLSVQSPDSLTSTGGIQGSIVSSPGVFTPPAQQFWMTPEMACHFMKFARGSYGWPMFLYSDCPLASFQLCRETSCCVCFKKPPSYIMDDNCCQYHTTALKLITGLSDDDLIYVSFHNRVYEVPFYVAVDHQTCSIVVSVRGTLSLRDVLTDLTAECDMICSEGCPPGTQCHRGMLRAASFVKRKLEESQALNDAFALHQSYSLVITGHSLGAGTAALLAFLLRPTYPNLKCFAFSPPGGLLSADGVKFSEDFVLSVVLGDDMIPRLSVPNMEDMKRKLLNCILDSDQPKYKVLLQGIWPNSARTQSPSSTESSSGQVSRPLLEHFGNNNSGANYVTNSSQEGSSEGSSSSSQITQQHSHTPLFPPGRILHIAKSDSSYRARWVTAEFFDLLIISPKMVYHHMPDVVHKALKMLTQNSGNFIP